MCIYKVATIQGGLLLPLEDCARIRGCVLCCVGLVQRSSETDRL